MCRLVHARNPAAGKRLADSFVATIEQIARRPEQHPLLEYSRNPGSIRRADFPAPLRYPLLEFRSNPAKLRRCVIVGFPLYVIYHVADDTLTVVAVHHASRRTHQWHKRLLP
jgi:plasmid stabilization system protein ParE